MLQPRQEHSCLQRSRHSIIHLLYFMLKERFHVFKKSIIIIVVQKYCFKSVYELYTRVTLLSKYKYILNTLLLFHRCVVAGIFFRSGVTSRSVATSGTTVCRLVSRKE